MASSSLGGSNTQILSLKLDHKNRLCMPFLQHGMQAGIRPKAWKHAGVMVSQRSNKALVVCRSQSSLVAEKEPAVSRIEEEGDKKNLRGPASQLIPNAQEVEFLLTEICDTTSIAEFELKLNGFHLRVMRASSGGIASPPPSPPGPASTTADTAEKVQVAASSGPVSTSLALAKAGPSEGGVGTLLERAADEGFALIQSPKVGFFRRSRTIKGKVAPPACKENQLVKEGQVICYIEQLGGEFPVETSVSGEVIRILRQDGEPVGYGDAVMAILPSFPGILPSFPGIKKLPN